MNSDLAFFFRTPFSIFNSWKEFVLVFWKLVKFQFHASLDHLSVEQKCSHITKRANFLVFIYFDSTRGINYPKSTVDGDLWIGKLQS